MLTLLSLTAFANPPAANDDFGVDNPPLIQVDAGVVTVWSMDEVVGHVWAEQVKSVSASLGDRHVEHWLYEDPAFALDPGASFTLEMRDPEATKQTFRKNLDHEVSNWKSRPYAPIPFHYTAAPPTELGLGILGPRPKALYHFELYQDGQGSKDVMCGSLLRVVYVDSQDEISEIREHWLFIKPFSMLDEVGEWLEVRRVAGPPPTSVPGFLSLYADEDQYPVMSYAEPVYDLSSTGADFE